MVDLVVFPDTTELGRRILLQELAPRGYADVPVGEKVPPPLPKRFIRFYTLPGREVCRRTQWVQTITQVYGDDEMWCQRLAGVCGAILRAAPDIVVDGEQLVSGPCEMHGPFPTQDPELPSFERFQVNNTWTVQSSVIP
jgi:hypothetical protein